MKIGIDLSSIQGPNRYRGIGSVAINILRNLDYNNDDKFIFYIYKDFPTTEVDVEKALNLGQKNYEIRLMEPFKDKKYLPGKLKYVQKAISKIMTMTSYRYGSKKYGDLSDVDAFIQLDQLEPLARLPKESKNYLIVYDLIPYILESDYLWTYRTARANGLNRRAAIKKFVKRLVYAQKIRLNLKKADKILCISKTTEADFKKWFKTPEDKFEVISLGADIPEATSKTACNGDITRYYQTSWGYSIKKIESLKNELFLLFIGGVDNRRKIVDLVTAFNQLRAQGYNIKLALAGDSMNDIDRMDNFETKNAILSSSYFNDIFLLGFVDDSMRNWLYQNTLAFVFPSVYEGVGLPVLEAMNHHAPVITYDNRATREVAKDFPLYASDPLSIVDDVKRLLTMDKKELLSITDKACAHSQKYNWKNTAASIMRIVHK